MRGRQMEIQEILHEMRKAANWQEARGSRHELPPNINLFVNLKYQLDEAINERHSYTNTLWDEIRSDDFIKLQVWNDEIVKNKHNESKCWSIWQRASELMNDIVDKLECQLKINK